MPSDDLYETPTDAAETLQAIKTRAFYDLASNARLHPDYQKNNSSAHSDFFSLVARI